MGRMGGRCIHSGLWKKQPAPQFAEAPIGPAIVGCCVVREEASSLLRVRSIISFVRPMNISAEVTCLLIRDNFVQFLWSSTAFNEVSTSTGP